MQISSLLPFLVDMLTGTAGKGKMNKAAAQDADKAARPVSGKVPGNASLAQGPPSTGGGFQPARWTAHVQAPPDYLPLPLNTPLFSDYGFFIENTGKEEATGRGAGAGAGILIRLCTENMGTIWISLVPGEKCLALTFYTEKDEYTAALRDSFPALKGQLRKSGHQSVNMAGVTRPGIKGLPHMSPGARLLELEV